MKLVNKITIKNVDLNPIMDEFAKEFARQKFYSMGDIYSRYN